MAISRYPNPSGGKSLAKPLTFHFSKRTVKNRLMKAAMAEGLSNWHDTDLEARGVPTPELIELYRR
jgi:hypothetical protein